MDLSLLLYLLTTIRLEGKQFQRNPGNIPDRSFIIVVPVTLHSQICAELKRFLRGHVFDILPVTGQYQTRQGYMAKFKSSQNKEFSDIDTIFVATTTVCDKSHGFTFPV